MKPPSGETCLIVAALVCALLAAGLSPAAASSAQPDALPRRMAEVAADGGRGSGRHLTACASTCSSVLGSAAAFGALGATTVTNTGANTYINGNAGDSPGTAITGLTSGQVSGTINAGDSVAKQAQADAHTGYSTLLQLPRTMNLTGQDLGGKTLTGPGVFYFAGSAHLTSKLTFDAKGNAAALFVLQIGTTFVSSGYSSMALVNGAQACNIFFQVGSSATIGEYSALVGSIVAYTSATTTTSASVSGSLIALSGAVTLQTNAVSAAGTCAGTGGNSSTNSSSSSPPPSSRLPLPPLGTTPPSGKTPTPPSGKTPPPPSGKTPPSPPGKASPSPKPSPKPSPPSPKASPKPSPLSPKPSPKPSPFGSPQPPPPTAVVSTCSCELLSASAFGALAASAIVNVGLTTSIKGSVGLSLGGAITGILSGQLSLGVVVDAQVALAAQADARIGVAALSSLFQFATLDLSGLNLGGRTLGHGTFTFKTSATLTGTLTLDARGDANAVFVFKVVTDLTTSAKSIIKLVNGAQPCNVYFLVGASATLGAGSSFSGSIVAATAVSVNAAATVSGNLVSLTAGLTLNSGVLTAAGACGAALL